MYFWKCWRDTRAFFLVFMLAGAAVIPLAVAIAGKGVLADFGPAAIASALSVLNPIMAYGIGALIATEQFADKTVHFLFTRPRTKTHFVWVAWAVGLAELLAFAGVNLLTGYCVMQIYSRAAVKPSLWGLATNRDLLSGLIYCLVVYCGTYAATALMRSGLKGLGLAIIGFSAAQAIAIVVRVRWHQQLPMPGGQFGSLSMAVSGILWMVVGLTVVFATQVRMNTAEL